MSDGFPAPALFLLPALNSYLNLASTEKIPILAICELQLAFYQLISLNINGMWDYFSLGYKTIIYTEAFSHLLFMVALCGAYTFDAWRRVALYVMTFFIGYSGSFMLHTLGYFSLTHGIVRWFVPLSIFAVAISNYSLKKNVFNNRYPDQSYRYLLSFIGGVIHGFSFPISLREFLFSATEKFQYILFYNMGFVTGIMTLVFFLLGVTFVLTAIIRLNLREWNLLLSGACAGIGLYMLAMSFR